MVNLDEKVNNLYKNTFLNETDLIELTKSATDLLKKEPNVLTVKAPVTVVGDIHGQFCDLQELFRISGTLPHTNFLFLGDYVDRGYYSVECVTLIMILKMRYPDKVAIIRGNHECRQVTQVYGFYDEVLRKYGSPDVWIAMTEFFDTLPLSAIINNRIFCPHAGLSPSFDSIDNIRNEIDRFVEPSHDGAMCDILWSDPSDTNGWGVSPRGAGYTFGTDITKKI